MVLSWYGGNVSPVETAKFMGKKGNGRICGQGTSMQLTVSKLAESPWSNFKGMKISKEQTITYLKSGIPIIFLCSKCTGAGSAGPRYYGGHYMVLTGVDKNGNITVNDPGANNRKAITNMSPTQLDKNNGFFAEVE